MSVEAIIALILQVISAAQTLTPAAIQAVEDFKKLFAGGQVASQADLDALIARLKDQSAQIQAIDA